MPRVAEPDPWGQLCRGVPGAVDARARGLAVAEVAAVRAAELAELVDALAIVRPNASVLPSAAAPTAVPISGFEILTLLSFAVAAGLAGVLGQAGWPAHPQCARRTCHAAGRSLSGPAESAAAMGPVGQRGRGGRGQDETVAVKHGTSSVFVFGRVADGWRIGLIDHPRFARLMLPGGHIEAEESPEQAALREVTEETGLAAHLVSPPVPPLPVGYQPPRVTAPWWIVEYEVPPDGHVTVPHVHVDYLYVAVAADPEPAARAAHPFGWHAAGDLPGLTMFDDTRLLAAALLAGLAQDALDTPGAGEAEDPRLALALLAGLGAAAGSWGV